MKTAGKFALCVAVPLLLGGVRWWAQNQPELLPPPRPVPDATEGRKIFFERGVPKDNPNDFCCNCCSCHQNVPILAGDLAQFTDDQLFNAIKKGVCEVSCDQIQIVGPPAPGERPPRVPRVVPPSAVLYTSGDRAFVYCDDVKNLRLPNMGRHMRGFSRSLTDDQIRDLVAYLRTRGRADIMGCRDFKP
ncbi:MAG: hypothetical protein ACLQOO_21100 [Terriglobia bacterium]